MARLQARIQQTGALGWLAVAAGLLIAAYVLVKLALLARHNPRVAAGAILFGWVAGQMVTIQLFPMTYETGRYLVPAVAPALFLLAGMVKLDTVRRTAMAAAIAGGALFLFAPKPPQAVTAFRSAMRSLPLSARGPVISVHSDAAGEGAMIAALVEYDRRRSSTALRGGKLLSESNWSGRNYRLLVDDPAAVNRMLSAMPIEYVVFDASSEPWPDLRLMKEALATSSGWLMPVSRHAVQGARRHGELMVYRRVSPLPEGKYSVTVPLGLENESRPMTCAQ